MKTMTFTKATSVVAQVEKIIGDCWVTGNVGSDIRYFDHLDLTCLYDLDELLPIKGQNELDADAAIEFVQDSDAGYEFHGYVTFRFPKDFRLVITGFQAPGKFDENTIEGLREALAFERFVRKYKADDVRTERCTYAWWD